jgi:hypothetical protein
MTRPSPEDILGETARLAFHLHWPLDSILDLEHTDRRLFLEEAEGMAAIQNAAMSAPAPVAAFAWPPAPEEADPGAAW